MKRDDFYKMLFTTLRIFFFCVSCVVFAVPFLFSDQKVCLNMPSNGMVLCVVFMLMALFETFDKLESEFESFAKKKKEQKQKKEQKEKTLNIFELYIFFMFLMCVVVFGIAGFPIAVSAAAVLCSLAYLIVKLAWLGRILDEYKLG